MVRKEVLASILCLAYPNTKPNLEMEDPSFTSQSDCECMSNGILQIIVLRYGILKERTMIEEQKKMKKEFPYSDHFIEPETPSKPLIFP